MAVQFQHVFAGERGGRWKEQREAAIEHFALRIAKNAQCGVTRFGQIAEQLPCNVSHACAGHANDADATATRRRCDGGNRVESDCRMSAMTRTNDWRQSVAEVLGP